MRRTGSPHLVDESIVSDAEPVNVVRTSKLLHAGRARVPGQAVNTCRETLADTSREFPELARGPGGELYGIG